MKPFFAILLVLVSMLAFPAFSQNKTESDPNNTADRQQGNKNPYLMDLKKDDAQPEWTPTPDKKTRFSSDDSLDKNSLEKKKLPNSTNFFVYGASIGSPGSINLNLGYYFKDVVVRVSGSHFSPTWWGGQVDLGYTFWKTPVIAHSISLVGGAFAVDPYNPAPERGGQRRYNTGVDFPGYRTNNPSFEDQLIRAYIAQANPNLAFVLDYEVRETRKFQLQQRYIGLTYDILLGNFFLQFGGGIGQGDYRNPQLLLQMGYLFDTRKVEE